MNCHQVDEFAGDFLAGRLPPEPARQVSTHLAGCPRCRSAVEELRLLLEAAREFPRSAEPPRDLWPGVISRLEGTGGRIRPLGTLRRPIHRLAPLVATAAAAALLLLGGRALVARLGPVGFSYSDFDPVEVVDLEFERLLAHLQADVDEQVSLPETAARTLQEGLRVIDQAIAETRAVAEHYPGEPELQRRLAGSYQTKLELLRWTASRTSGNEVLYGVRGMP